MTLYYIAGAAYVMIALLESSASAWALTYHTMTANGGEMDNRIFLLTLLGSAIFGLFWPVSMTYVFLKDVHPVISLARRLGWD